MAGWWLQFSYSLYLHAGANIKKDRIPFKATRSRFPHFLVESIFEFVRTTGVFSSKCSSVELSFFFFPCHVNAPQLSFCQADCCPTSQRQQCPNSFSLWPPRSSAWIPIKLHQRQVLDLNAAVIQWNDLLNPLLGGFSLVKLAFFSRLTSVVGGSCI